MKFNKKIVLITGSTKGIGKTIAIKFANEGATVILNGRDKKRGEDIIKLINKTNKDNNSIFIPADVGNYSDIKKLFKKIVNKFDNIDILINNAGIHEVKSFLQINEKDWDKIFQVNLKGTFYCCKEALKYMLQNKKGIILNMTSIAAKTGGILPVAHYAASKAAIISLTKSLAREFAQFGIRCNAIAPGTIKTNMTSSFNSNLLGEIPLKKLGTTNDIANAAAFLCSDEASYITGEILDVNGGQFMD